MSFGDPFCDPPIDAIHATDAEDIAHAVHKVIMLLTEIDPSGLWKNTEAGRKFNGAIKALADVHGRLRDSDRNLLRVLCEHWPTLTCDHEKHQDSVACSCALWGTNGRSTVGAAIMAWAAHVVRIANMPMPPPRPEYSAEIIAHASDLVDAMDRDGLRVDVAAKFLHDYEQRKCCGPKKGVSDGRPDQSEDDAKGSGHEGDH